MSAWAELVHSDKSDEHLRLCEEAMMEIQRTERVKCIREISKEISEMVDSGFSSSSIEWRLRKASLCLEETQGNTSLEEAVRKAKEVYED